jgi:hypothetical protein
VKPDSRHDERVTLAVDSVLVDISGSALMRRTLADGDDGPPRCLGLSSTLDADPRDIPSRLIRLWIARCGHAE